MKRPLSVFLGVLFMLANSGILISGHWCGGRLWSVHVFSGDKHDCPCGDKDMVKGCCKDKVFHFKANKYLQQGPECDIACASPLVFVAGFASEVQLLPQPVFYRADHYHPPPFKPRAALYLLNEVFRI